MWWFPGLLPAAAWLIVCLCGPSVQEGARNGPSLMPGGPREAYHLLEPILVKIAAQVDGMPCVTYIGELGSGNYVKMVHNGIEYGDMQLIAEAYDILHTVCPCASVVA